MPALRALSPLAVLALAAAACNLLRSSPSTDAQDAQAPGPTAGGSCPSSSPEVVVSGYPVADVAADDQSVYFLSNDDVDTVPVQSPRSSSVKVLATASAAGFRIGIDSTHVYWSYNGGVGYGSIPTLDVIGKNGQGEQQLVTTSLGPSVFARFLAVDAAGVYYSSLDGSVRAVVAATGASLVLAGGLGPSNVPMGLAPVNGTLYYSVANPGAIMAVPESGGSSRAVVSGITNPGPLAADAHNVYWLQTGSNGAVWQAPIDGSAPPVALAPTGPNPNAIAIDSTNVYWNDSATIGVVPIGGGAVSYLACRNNYYQLFVSRSYVYWVDDAQAIVRVPKPGVIGPAPEAGAACGAPGATCGTASDCCSGTCDAPNDAGARVCDKCLANGQSCTYDGACCTGFCGGQAPGPYSCMCSPDGWSCTTGATCCGGSCITGVCSSGCGGNGAGCEGPGGAPDSALCCPGYHCAIDAQTGYRICVPG